MRNPLTTRKITGFPVKVYECTKALLSPRIRGLLEVRRGFEQVYWEYRVKSTFDNLFTCKLHPLAIWKRRRMHRHVSSASR